MTNSYSETSLKEKLEKTNFNLEELNYELSNFNIRLIISLLILIIECFLVYYIIFIDSNTYKFIISDYFITLAVIVTCLYSFAFSFSYTFQVYKTILELKKAISKNKFVVEKAIAFFLSNPSFVKG